MKASGNFFMLYARLPRLERTARSAVDADAAGRLLLQVLVAAERREAPVLGDDDLLPAGNLYCEPAEGLKSDRAVWQGFG